MNRDDIQKVSIGCSVYLKGTGVCVADRYTKGEFCMKNKFAVLLGSVMIGALCMAGCGENAAPLPQSSAGSEVSENVQATSASEQETSSESEEQSKTEEQPESVPEVSDPPPDGEAEFINGLLVYNGVAYEQFFGDDDMAENYADVMSSVKKSLGDGITVYNVLIPTHCGVTLPDKFKDYVASQEDYLNKITSSYSVEGIIPVNTYDTLLHHRDEYIYFNTDHHWTGRAAYYAYADFCKTAGIDAIPLDSMTSKKIEGYQGSLADSDIAGLDNLKEDYVEYFTVDKDIETMLYDDTGEELYEYSLIHEYAEGVNAYGVFLGGDQPLIVSENADGNGKKIAVVKESYGNAFCPFIAYTYSETHMIDSRYAEFNLNSYLAEHDIDEVIFINNAMASATYQRCEELEALVD